MLNDTLVIRGAHFDTDESESITKIVLNPDTPEEKILDVGSSGVELYNHTIYFKNAEISCSFICSVSTPFTTQSLANWLRDNNHTSSSNCLCVTFRPVNDGTYFTIISDVLGSNNEIGGLYYSSSAPTIVHLRRRQRIRIKTSDLSITYNSANDEDLNYLKLDIVQRII